MTAVLVKYIGEVKRIMAEDAEAAMMRPKHELFGLGLDAGKYQGLHKALEILDNILRDTEEKERKS